MSDPTEEPVRGEPDWQRLARAIKSRRIELGIETQKEAAEKAGFAHNTWNRLENGQGARPETLEAVARVLGWPPSRPSELLYEPQAAERSFEPRRRGRVWANALDSASTGSPAEELFRAYMESSGLDVPPVLPGQLDARFQRIDRVPDVAFLSIVIPFSLSVASRLTSEDVDAIEDAVRHHALGMARMRDTRMKLRRMIGRLRRRGMSAEEIAEDLGVPAHMVASVLSDMTDNG